MCDEVINCFTNSGQIKLFRPSYGKIRKKILKKVKNDYKIIMWDVLSYDFSHRIPAGKCLEKSIKYTRNGSITIFHDSKKSFDKNKLIISQYIQHYKRLNYDFCKIEDIYL